MLLGIFCLSLFTVSCGQGGSSKQVAEAEVTFSVNLSCGGCQSKVENNLPLTEGVKEMKVTLGTKEVWVLYDTKKTDKEKLANAIVQMGFTAEEVTSGSCCSAD